MGLYLIDFENVHDMGINGITTLTDQDEVCLFYSSKSEHLSFETHVNIMQTNARIKYIKLRRSAKNYLDFQLVTHLGYLIGSGEKGPYYIISKDTGFDSVIDYWKDHGVTVTRQPAIEYNRNLTTTSGRQGSSKTPPALVTVQENKQVSGQAMQPYSVEIQTPAAPAAPASPEKTADVPKEILPQEAPAVQEETASKNRSRRNNQKGKKAAEEKTAEKAIVTALMTVPVQEQPKKEESAVKDNTAEEKAAPAVQENPPASLPESYRKKVRTALKGKEIPSAHYSAIYKALVNSYDKLALNNLLVKTFGSSKGGAIYNQIKDIFTDYHNGR